MFKVYETQNWRVSKEIYMKLDMAKNIDMIMFRMTRNLSQVKAAELAGVPVFVWRDIENKKLIPTETEASKIAFIMGRPVFKLFPHTRHDTIRVLPVRNMSKLALVRCVHGVSQVQLAKGAEVPMRVIHGLEREWSGIEEIPVQDRIHVQHIADYLREDIVNIIGPAIREGDK